MKRGEIILWRWYRTTQGTGECVSLGDSTQPPRFNIVLPWPQGHRYISRRDVLEEVKDPTKKK